MVSPFLRAGAVTLPAQRPRQHAVQQVLSKLESLMSEGALPPDGRLPPERELARRLSTSRATLREALRVLRALGMIESAPRRGTRVLSAPSVPIQMVFPNLLRFANPEDVMQARMLLEPGIAWVAALRASPSDWQALRECVQGGLTCSGVEEFEQWDREFHIRLARSTRNEVLAYLSTLLQGIRDDVVWGRLKRRDLSRKQRRMEYVQDHQRIVEAIEAREPQRAFQCMHDHLVRVRTHLLKGVDTPGQGLAPSMASPAAPPASGGQV